MGVRSSSSALPWTPLLPSALLPTCSQARHACASQLGGACAGLGRHGRGHGFRRASRGAMHARCRVPAAGCWQSESVGWHGTSIPRAAVTHAVLVLQSRSPWHRQVTDAANLAPTRTHAGQAGAAAAGGVCQVLERRGLWQLAQQPSDMRRCGQQAALGRGSGIGTRSRQPVPLCTVPLHSCAST